MSLRQVALYARVSCESQAQARTIPVPVGSTA